MNDSLREILEARFEAIERRLTVIEESLFDRSTLR